MALLMRPCRRLIQAFGKLPVTCHVQYIRGFKRATRTQGYVTVTPKPDNSVTSTENLELSRNNLNPSDVSSLSLTTNLQQRLISLCYDAKNGRINRQKLLEIFDGSPSGLALLRYCGTKLPYVKSAERRILTSHVWKLIVRDASALTLEHYNTLLDIHAQNNETVDPKKFLAEMTVKPDGTTYRLLLNVVARYGNVESALELLSRMKNKDYPLSETVFNQLILAHATAKDMKAVLSTLDTMRSSRIEPSIETYANIACGYASIGDIDNTMKILNAHPFNVVQIMEIVKRLSSLNFGMHIPTVLKCLPPSMSMNDEIFLNTVTQLTHDGRPEDAFEVINFVTPAATTDETNPIFKSFLNHMVLAKIPNSTVLKLLNEIVTAKNYPLGIMDICESALNSGEHELAMFVFEVMHEKRIEVRPHYYWPLLIKASRIHGETDVFRILKHMLGLNVFLDHDTIVTHVLPYINTVDPFVTLKKFADLGVQISVIFTPLICYLLYEGNFKETLDLCSRIKAPIDFVRVLNPLVTTYKINKNVNDCVEMFKFAPSKNHYPEEFLLILFGKRPTKNDARLLNEFLRAFEAAKIPVSNFTASATQDNDGADGQDELTLVNPLESVRPSNRIPHPRHMSLVELECHLIELKAKGMNVRGTLRKLLQLHCQHNNVNRAEEIKKEYDEKGFVWTPGMYSSLLQLYVKHGRVEEAMSLYSKLQIIVDFKIDNFKIIELATALTRANRINDAIAILKSTTSTSRISKDCWRLLDAVAHSTSPELTESMLEVLVENGFCERSNTILGPLVRAHLLRDDLASAVDKFAECAETYGYIPLRQELIYSLVKSINTNKSTKNEAVEMLKKVATVSTKISGSTNVQTDLFLALARLEMTDELRKFLQKNKVSDRVLNASITLIPEDQKLPIMTTLLEASKEIPNMNRNFIYEQALAVHSRSGDCEQAIELWKKWSAEDEPMSRAFRKVIVSLLTKHKVPLPEGLSDIDQ